MVLSFACLQNLVLDIRVIPLYIHMYHGTYIISNYSWDPTLLFKENLCFCEFKSEFHLIYTTMSQLHIVNFFCNPVQPEYIIL